MQIAIVGIGCRLPGGASTPDEFWQLLADGIDAITQVPPDRFDVDTLFDPDPAAAGTLYTRWGGFLEGIDAFDAGFFGISPREARRIDPQHRLLLEVVWEALEDGGQPPDHLAGSSTGVFVGLCSHDYGDIQMRPGGRSAIDAHVNPGNAASIAANRVSYLLDLRGPSFAVDTACSSSLTAVHLACQSLRSGECDLAVAGAVNAILTPEPTIGFCRATMLSPDGRCKPFDARADGYVRSEGAGAVVLKPLDRALADGDPVYAVIRGTAINQDGRTPGIAVPNPAAQQALLEQALRDAGVPPAAVGYVEAHGTGTPVGDPREAHAIGAVMSAGRRADRPLLVGSVKGNVGHLEAGAGVVGLIKTALALQHRRIPPTVHFRDPNPAIPFDELRLRVPTALEEWPAGDGPAIAGVNSFGFGGANAHVVMEEPPAIPEYRSQDDAPSVLTVSARSPEALRELARRYAEWLRRDGRSTLRDVCYTASVRRSHHDHRLAAVATSKEQLAAALDGFVAGEPPAAVAVGRAPREPPKLAFVYSGMGPQWWGMARRLLRDEPVFRHVIMECDRLLSPLADWSLIAELAADEERSRLDRTDVAQVANVAVQIGLTELWRSWGVVPDAVVGHSAGEVAAAWAAGALRLADALRLAFHRARLLDRASGTGGMLAAGVSLEMARHLADQHQPAVSIAAVNGANSVTFSGPVAALTEIADSLERRGSFHRMLAVTVPYHGSQLDPLRGDLMTALADLDPQPPEIPIVSTSTGAWHDGRQFDAGHWWRNMRRPVLFAAAVEQLLADDYGTFLEVSAHPVLAASIVECLEEAGRDGIVLPTLRRGEDDRTVMLRSLAALYTRGRRVEWSTAAGAGGRCVRLPGYAWQHERHWFEPPAGPDGDELRGVDSGHPLLGRRLPVARPVWEVALAGSRLAYLDGHVLQGAVTFPGAGYVEMALAAARAFRGESSLRVEGIEFSRLLSFPARDGVALQCLVDERDSSVEMHSRGTGEPRAWTLRASARIAERAPDGREPVDLREIRDRCPTVVDTEAFYDSLEERHGLRYDGAFRGVAELRRGHGEALGRIECPAGVELSVDGYHVHPALLDSAFQVLGAVEGLTRQRGALVPISIGRVELRGSPGARFWSHASIDHRDGAVVEGSIRVMDDAGAVVLSCKGFRLMVLDETVPEPIEEWLYEEQWEPAPRTDGQAPQIPPAGELAAAARSFLDRLAAENGFGQYYSAIEPRLNMIAARYVREAFGKLGFEPDRDAGLAADTLADRLGVAGRHRRFFDRLLEIARLGDPDGAQASLPDDPPYQSAFCLLRESGKRLAETLRGEADAREWLFAGESFRALAGLYAANPWFSVYSAAVAEVVAQAQNACLPRKVRVLEVGAGTGGTTAHVLSRLRPDVFDYVFTDVSSFFVRSAAERFHDRPNLRAETFDVEQPPAEAEAFDVVIAADVVHATADIRATLRNLRGCLAPGGLLVLLEPVRRSPWLELVFGQLESWWRLRDGDLRPRHPLLGVERWQELLEESGFAGTASMADTRAPGDGDPIHAVLLATTPAEVPRRSPRPARRWLVLTDQRGVGPELAAALRERGDACTLVWPGASYRRYGADGVELSPARPADWRRLVEDEHAVDGVIHLWSLDAPEQPRTSELMTFQQVTCGSVMSLVQVFRGGGRPLPEVWLVTAGAQPVEAGDGAVRVAQSPLWGLGRVLRSEQPGAGCRLVDLSPEPATEDVEALVAEIDTGESAEETPAELALRAGRRYARRLRRAELQPAVPPAMPKRLSPREASFRAEVLRPGALDTVVLCETPVRGPGPGEVAIRVLASGLNFRDVLVALGMPFASAPDQGYEIRLGWECAGVVEACGEDVADLRPGDAVMAGAGGALGSRIVTRVERVVPKPARLSFEEAATVPVAFLTAEYGLSRLARLAAGERVLIHSAAGGVGLAAVQIARRAGAEIFTTAGTPEKRAYLESLGIAHVMDSRSLRFADEVLERTGGEGVDVVLNSLAGDALVKGLALLRPWGRFVELGKRDFHEDSRLGLRPFRRNLSFFAVDLEALFEDRPQVLGEVLREIGQRIGKGELEPLPHHRFDLAEAEQAIRLMAQGRHIGKIVLSLREPAYQVRQPVRGTLFRSDASYLVAGGLGGFGLAVAGWMAREGAGAIVLTSRSGVPRPEDQPALDALRSSAANVAVVSADVTDRADMERVLARIRATMPPLKGVVHAAMVLDDGLLETLDYRPFDAVLAPKLAGAWNLHQLTLDDDLDLFVLFSSVSALVGPPTQGGYAAANCFLGSLAAHRRALGRPAVTIDWGVLAEVGYVARRPELERRLARYGFRSMAVRDACAALRRVIGSASARVAVARVDGAALWQDPSSWDLPSPETGPGRGTVGEPAPSGTGDGVAAQLAAAPARERPAILERYLVRRTARVLDAPPERIDLDRPLPEMGLDSLMAVELRTAVRTDLGIEVPIVDLLEALSLRKLAISVLDRMSGDGDR